MHNNSLRKILDQILAKSTYKSLCVPFDEVLLSFSIISSLLPFVTLIFTESSTGKLDTIRLIEKFNATKHTKQNFQLSIFLLDKNRNLKLKLRKLNLILANDSVTLYDEIFLIFSFNFLSLYYPPRNWFEYWLIVQTDISRLYTRLALSHNLQYLIDWHT